MRGGSKNDYQWVEKPLLKLMQIEIIYDEFKVPFSDLVDKEKYEVIKTERENTWLVKKVEETNAVEK